MNLKSLLLLVIVASGSSSCVKEYTCTCVSKKDNSTIIITDVGTKKRFKKNCIAMKDYAYSGINVADYNCTVTPGGSD